MMSPISRSILLCSLVLMATSCRFDAGSIITGNGPDNRFEESELLPPPDAPIIPATDSFSLLVIADPHYGVYSRSILAATELHKSRAYDFLIINGDATQRGVQEEWDSVYNDMAELGVPAYFTIGNHDLYNDGYDQFYSNFGPTHYSFQVGEVLFLFLDTGNGVVAQAEKKWYEEQLAHTSATRIITFTHYSLLTRFVQHMVTLPNPEEFYWFVDINATYGVDAMVMGHIHNNLEETFRGVRYISQTNAGDLENPQGLIITYANGELSYELVALPYDAL